MPFQIQGNSGKIYDFEDDVPLEKAAEFINLKEPPKSWSDIPEMGLGLAKGNWTQAAAGLAQAYGDVMPGFLGSETALTDAARLRAQAQQETEQAVGGATPLQRDVAGGVASVIQNIPTIALGTGRGLVGLASGMGAKEAAITGGEAALRGMVGPEVLGEYGQQREAGMGGLRSAFHAGVHGVAEYVPERLAFTPLVNLLSLGKGPTLSAIGSFLGRDLVGEEATTVMEFVNQKLSRRPDATLGDLLDEMKSTAVSTLVSGPLQAGFGAGVAAAAMPVARRVAPEELSPGNIPYSSQDLIPAAVPPATTAEPSATFTPEPQVVEPKVTLGSYTNARLADAQIAPTEISPAEAAIFRDVPALEPDASLNEALGANFEPRTYDASLDAIYRTYPHAENARATPVLASTDSSITPGSIVTDFNALPEGSVTIIGSQEMTPLQQARLHPIMRQIHAWAQEFLPDKRFVLSTSAFSYDNPAFDRPFHTVLGDNTSGFFFASNEGVSALETQFRDITNIGHEFTHAVTEYRLADAAPDMRQRIFNGFVEWRNRAGTTPASKWFAEGMTAKRYESLMAEAKVRGIDTEIPGAEFIRQFEASGPHKGYYGSFNEWLAEQGSLYFTNRGFFTDPEVKSWYQKVAAELKRFYNRFIGKFQTNPDFEAWMDELRVKPVSQAVGRATTTVAESFGDPIRVATEHSRYTTQFVNALPMKTTITRKEAQGLLAKMPLPKAEKALVQEVLNQPQFMRERFAREWLVDEINRRVLALAPKKYTSGMVPEVMIYWGWDKLVHHQKLARDTYTASYEGNSNVLPFATVWRAPFELGADPHFDDPYYFAHTRAFDFGSDARAVFEVQSNFFQGDKQGLTAEEQATIQEKIKQINEFEEFVYRTGDATAYVEALKKPGWHDLAQAAAYEDIENLPSLTLGFMIVKHSDRARHRLQLMRAEQEGKLAQAIGPGAKLQSDFADIWTRRIIREEVRKAAHEGKRTLRWSTADTMAKVEGWTKYPTAGQSVFAPELKGKRFHEDAYGKTITFTGELRTSTYGNIVAVLSDGSFYRADNGLPYVSQRDDAPIQKVLSDDQFLKLRDTFKLEWGSNQPIWNRHKKSIEDYIRREYAGRDVTDDLGNTWVEMDVPISAATEAVEAFSMPIHVGLGHVAKTLGLKGTNYSTIPHATAKINFGLKTALGAFQLLKMNQHVPGAQEYKQALRNSMQYKHEWLAEADAILNEWTDLPPDQASKLANLMFEEAEQAEVKGQTGFKSTIITDPNNPNRVVFKLSPAEKKRFGLSDKAEEIYSKVRSHFRAALDEMERVGISEIMAPEFDPVVGITLREMLRRKAPTADMLTFVTQTLAKTQNQVLAAQVQAKIDELRKDFALMREKAYMPYSRFGREGVLVKDPKSKETLYFETFETEKELREALPAIKQRFAGSAISVTRLEDIPYMFQGVPQSFFRAVADKIGIVPGSAEYAAYMQLIKDTTNAASFVRRMKRKQGVEGYSIDAMRGYADYFKRFGNYISRVKRSGELNYSMEVLSDYIKSLESDPRGVHDTRKLRELHEWLAEHKAYIDNPGNELSEVKSFVALWFFGGNISSAVMNATQVPFVTLPYLSKRFGVARTVKELKRGYTDMARMWKNPRTLSADEQAMWAHALESGFVDESFATVMAQIADGNVMSRVHPVGKWRRATNAFNHYAMWPFQKAEYINRGVTLLAAYRMNRKAGFNGTFDEAAFNAARGAVEDTQNEYAQEARPTFMRGNWSVIFQFMSFMQNMLFQMLGGDASWKRLLLTQLFLAGVLGAPFVEDIKNAIKFLARMWGMDFDPEREARLFLEDMDINSDLILRGMTSNAFGFDLSQRISLGNVIPGMRAVGSNKRFNESVADATGDIAGPGIGVFLNIMRFLAQDDKASLRSLEMIAPSGLRNVIKGVRSEVEGGMKDASGAVLHDPEWWEELGMVVGFMPEQLSDAYTSRTLQQEAANYWTQRRGNLLQEWSYVMLDKDGSREGVADVMEAVRDFNANAPDVKLRISLDTLRRTVKERAKANLRRELGLGSSRMTENLSAEIAQTFE